MTTVYPITAGAWGTPSIWSSGSVPVAGQTVDLTGNITYGLQATAPAITP